MSEMQLEDLALPQEIEKDPVFENPEGLTLTEIEKKAKEWNKDWESASTNLKDNWEENAIIYKEFEKKANKKITTKVPEVWSQIQTQAPHLVSSIFSRSEIVRNFPKFIDDTNRSTRVKLYVNSALLTASKARYKITDAVQNFLVYGNAVVKSFWNIEEEYEYNRQMADWYAKQTGKPDFDNVNLFNFAVDPTYRGHDVNKAPWVRERVWYSKEELKRMKQSGEVENFEDSDLVTKEEKGDTKADSRDYEANKNKIYVDEFWATMYWEEDDENGEKVQMQDDYFFWLLNDKKVIKFKKNWFKYKPYLISRCYRVSDEFWGQGDVDIMKAYADQMSDIHTKAGILAKRVGGKLTFYTPSSGFSKTDAKTMEDGCVMVDDINQIKSENTTAGADLQAMLAYKQSIKNDITSATGINEVIKGEPVGDQTATEASMLQQNSSARLTIKLQNIQTEIIAPLAEHYFKMSKQFIEEYMFQYKGQMVQLSQEDFEGDYDWVPVGSVSQSNKALQIKQKTELAMNLAQASQMAQQTKMAGFDLMKFIRDEVLPNFDIVDSEKYFTDAVPPPVPPNMATGEGPDMMGQPPQGSIDPNAQAGMANPANITETIPDTASIEGNATNVMS